MTDGPADSWYDDAAGPLVRPYALVKGRTRPARCELDLATQVRSVRTRSDPASMSVEHLEIVKICRRPLSVAEIAAHLDLPLVVVKVLLSDLIERGEVFTGDPSRTVEVPDRNLLRKVLEGVRNL